MILPLGIVEKVHQDFEQSEIEIVLTTLTARFVEKKKSWTDNVIRAAVYLAKGDRVQLLDWLATDDSRTILIQAELQSGNYGHYFNLTFPEVDQLNKLMQIQLANQIRAQEEAPPDLFADDF